LKETYPTQFALADRLEVWSDTGKHFRSFLFTGLVLGGLPVFFGDDFQTGWQTFVEHHGKSIADTFFAILTTLLQEAWRRKLRVATPLELFDAYQQEAKRRADEVWAEGCCPARIHLVLENLSTSAPLHPFSKAVYDSRDPVLSNTYCLRNFPGRGVLDCGFSNREDGTPLPTTFVRTTRTAKAAAKVPTPAPPPRQSKLDKIAAKFDMIAARCDPSFTKRPRLADSDALAAFSFDLSIVADQPRWARTLATATGIQFLYNENSETHSGLVLGTVLDKILDNGEEKTVAKHFGLLGPIARVFTVAELVQGACANPPTVRFLREGAGARGPAFHSLGS